MQFNITSATDNTAAKLYSQDITCNISKQTFQASFVSVFKKSLVKGENFQYCGCLNKKRNVYCFIHCFNFGHISMNKKSMVNSTEDETIIKTITTIIDT